MRSACSGRASFLVEMDVKGTSFTIRDLDEIEGPGQVVLCEVHISRLKAPKGWDLIDDRSQGNLVQFPEVSEERPRRLRRNKRADLKREGFEEVVTPISDARHPLNSENLETKAAPSPEKTPLLARAFSGLSKHPSLPQSKPGDRSGSMTQPDLFEDQDWDQRDSTEKDNRGSDGDEIDYDSFDLEPIA